MSQAGLQPIRAGRFTVHTPTYPPDPERINFEIDAGLAFGTGQHATTSGCLAALDELERQGAAFRNIADIGTGTGLLAFAALRLWPEARCIATDIDPVAIDVARDNAAINGVRLGMHRRAAPGSRRRLGFALAYRTRAVRPDCCQHPCRPADRASGGFHGALAPGGTILLAGLLDTQADAVAKAYRKHRLTVVDRGFGEWPVIVCQRAA